MIKQQLIFLFVFCIFSSLGYSAEINNSGTYEGEVAGSSTSCIDPANDGFEASFFIVSINQNGNSFSGSISTPDGGSGNVSGKFDNESQFSGTFQSSHSSGNISGIFYDSKMEASFVDTVPADDGCITSFSGAFNKISIDDGSASDNEEPDSHVATLSESLNIHIPELDYQIHHGEISKLEIYLSPYPSIEGRLTWKSESFSNVICSSTGNNCSNNFQVAIASSDEVEEYVPFDIHIPIIIYNGTQYWANLEFAGISNGNYLWQLGQFDVADGNNSSICNFPYESVNGFHKSISRPTCGQKWNLWNYHTLGTTLQRNDFNVLYAQYEGILDRRAYNEQIIKVAQTAIETVNLTNAVSNGVAEEIAGSITSLVSNNLTRYISHDSAYLDATLRVKGVINDSIVAAANGVGNPVIAVLNLAPETINTIMTFVASYRTGEIVEKLNEINIAGSYLNKYYQFGGNAQKVSESLTGSTSSSFEDIIIEVAQELKLENKWYGDDYSYDRAVEIIEHYRDTVIPEITRITIKN